MSEDHTLDAFAPDDDRDPDEIDPANIRPEDAVGNPLRPGDYVIDREDDDREENPTVGAHGQADDSVAVVIEHTGEQLDEATVGDTDQTVAEYNSGYDPTGLTVEIAFVAGSNGLDSTTGRRWREWRDESPEELAAKIAAWREEWRVGPRVYSYPSRRLERIADDS